ncbi:hypothetical protein NDU88_007519 [Pleurodeles waltl]|uniref:Uncharacterized protein n=1 Tax=Pleurodeles waltl TaxID=8319 RepID=A0AAV7RPP2_PLEWA|nr:hypothetical protein NDU88_007519 [Pleurodeles waltl]
MCVLVRFFCAGVCCSGALRPPWGASASRSLIFWWSESGAGCGRHLGWPQPLQSSLRTSFHCGAHARLSRFSARSIGEETGESVSGQGSFVEDSLVEALDSNVQYSVNKALAKALGPLTSQLKGFVRQQSWFPSLPLSESSSQIPNPGGKAKGKSQGKRWQSDAFEQFSASVLADHGYSHSSQASTSSDNSPDALSSDSSSQDSSDSDQADLPGPSKKRRRDRDSVPAPSPPKVLTFDPTEIVHPRSSNWVPLPEVASYVQCHLRQGFDKEVRARL